MRGADDHVAHVRVRGDDRRQGIDHELEALGRTQEPEAQDHLAPFEAQARLDHGRVGEGQVGDAVGDDVEARGSTP